MSTKPWVYLAGPYSQGDCGINVHYACQLFDEVISWGTLVPVAPLWTHLQHLIFPRKYATWLEYDKEVCSRCDAVYRYDVETVVNGTVYRQSESSGADAEVELFIAHAKPVFRRLDKLRQWGQTQSVAGKF